MAIVSRSNHAARDQTKWYKSFLKLVWTARFGILNRINGPQPRSVVKLVFRASGDGNDDHFPRHSIGPASDLQGCIQYTFYFLDNCSSFLAAHIGFEKDKIPK